MHIQPGNSCGPKSEKIDLARSDSFGFASPSIYRAISFKTARASAKLLALVPLVQAHDQSYIAIHWPGHIYATNFS